MDAAVRRFHQASIRDRRFVTPRLLADALWRWHRSDGPPGLPSPRWHANSVCAPNHYVAARYNHVIDVSADGKPDLVWIPNGRIPNGLPDWYVATSP
jgi:hypothetical protein